MIQVEKPSSTANSVPASLNGQTDLYSLPPGFVEAPVNYPKPHLSVSTHHVEIRLNSSTPQPGSFGQDHVEMPLENYEQQTSIPREIHEFSIEHRTGQLTELPERTERTGRDVIEGNEVLEEERQKSDGWVFGYFS